jgi:hypothetical protein
MLKGDPEVERTERKRQRARNCYRAFDAKGIQAYV